MSEQGYECESCGCTEPEEVTGGWRCSKCGWQPVDCTCYEMTGGHQPMCPYGVMLHRQKQRRR